MDSQEPIFIVGSVRTGTSIITHALQEGAGIPGYVEGCFVEFLGALIRQVDEAYKYRGRLSQLHNKDVMLAHVPQDEFLQSYIAWFREQYEKYSTYSGRWIDKTASRNAVYGIPYAQKAWPHARFILTKRRPIENITSRLQKFPNPTFESHCTMWATIEREVKIAKQHLRSGTYIEIDQYDIATKPHETAKQIGLFLNLDVLQIKEIENIFTYDRPEFTGGDESIIRSLDEMPWTTAQKDYFLKICGPIAEERGWSLGNTYYTTPL